MRRDNLAIILLNPFLFWIFEKTRRENTCNNSTQPLPVGFHQIGTPEPLLRSRNRAHWGMNIECFLQQTVVSTLHCYCSRVRRSRSSSGGAKSGRCRTAPGSTSTPAGGAWPNLFLPPLLSYHLLLLVLCDLHVWPRTIKCVQWESSGRRRCRRAPGVARNLHPHLPDT